MIKMEKIIKIDQVARTSQNFGGVLKRGIKSGDEWYNVIGNSNEEVDKYFNDGTFAEGKTVKLILDDKKKNVILKAEPYIRKNTTNKDDIMEKLMEYMNMPKLEIGLTEKRSIAQYETKEYTAKAWIPFDELPTSDDMSKMMDDLQAVITMQEEKDGIKPLRNKQHSPSAIDKAFGD